MDVVTYLKSSFRGLSDIRKDLHNMDILRLSLIVSIVYCVHLDYCESQVLEIRELELLLINIYRPPSAPKQLFEDILNRCQEIIIEVIEKENTKAKTTFGFGDYNFPLIKWPSNRIYSRDKEPAQMASEKQQAKLLLEWAEQNFMEQFIHTATRKGNILDWVFSNSNDLIHSYSTIVNKLFSDHNILKVNLN